MTIESKIVIPILIACGVVFVIAIVLILFLWFRTRQKRAEQKKHLFRGFTRRQTFELTCNPSPGTYSSPTRVQLSSIFEESCNILVDVSFAPLPKDRQETAVRLLGTDEKYGGHFLLYRYPFYFVNPGRYTIHAHTVYPTLRVVGAVHLFVFDIVTDDVSGHSSGGGASPVGESLTYDASTFSPPMSPTRAPATLPPPPPPNPVPALTPAPRKAPLPPRIIPGKGEVTNFTPITIAPHEESCTPDQIRFSADGTHPSLLYTGPFTLSVPPVGASNAMQQVPVTVRALAVSDHDRALTSTVVEANLVVYAAGHTFCDPQIPPPVGRIVAKEADLYFDVSRQPANSKILYQLVYINEARQKAKFSRKRSIEYDGKPVRLQEDLAYVYAWTFIENDIDFYNRNANNGERSHIRSSAAVYDCASASTWNRDPCKVMDIDRNNSYLPPPIICVSCNEMELFFEDPPAGGIICYTLDNTEPCRPDMTTTARRMADIGFSGVTRVQQGSGNGEDNLATRVYRENQPIHVTLLRTEEVFVTARTFIPIADPSAGGVITGYRYGERFHRSFVT